jgi:hypothetical protein
VITLNKQAAQGDILVTRIKSIPKDVVPMTPEGKEYVVAHSETGHHHVVQREAADAYVAANDPFVMFLVVDNEAEVKHLRDYDTHETLKLKMGFYRINRQREYIQEGFRPALD